jgi:hypothetical protein
MATIKGIDLLSRIEFIENHFGTEKYFEFLKKISTPEENFKRRPVDGSNSYPEETLVKIDELLLQDYFKNDTNKFFELGMWNAQRMVPKFFNLYIDEKNPAEFLMQYNRLRDFLIGSGIMKLQVFNSKSYGIQIDYEQPIPESVCLSEKGFIVEGIKMCSGREPDIEDISPSLDSNEFVYYYNIKIK